ncbi:MAG: ABC transporter permease [Proteobacteria bacterium]|nr:ABC transporter permease [Pseudomonadota bacterium]
MTGSGKGARRRLRATVPLGAYAALVCVFLLSPLVIAVALSFSSGEQLAFPPPGFSLRWYREALATEQFLTGVWVSTVIALATGAVSALGGTGAAIAINHFRFRGRALVQSFVLLPLSIPGVVVGLGILFALGMLGMKSGIAAAIAGHSVLGVPYVTYLVLATLSNYDLTLEQASLNLGAGRWLTFRRITLPLIAPGILAGAICAFLISFDNVALSIFLTRGDTLPLRLMQHIQFYANPGVAAVSSLLVAASLVVMLVLGRILRRRQIVGLAG